MWGGSNKPTKIGTPPGGGGWGLGGGGGVFWGGFWFVWGGFGGWGKGETIGEDPKEEKLIRFQKVLRFKGRLHEKKN